MRTWVQAASVVRSMKWDFTSGTTKSTVTTHVKAAVPGRLNAKKAGPPTNSLAAAQVPTKVFRCHIRTPAGAAEAYLLGTKADA